MQNSWTAALCVSWLTRDLHGMCDRDGMRDGVDPDPEETRECIMLREQVSNFLQSAVVFLLMTNALSAIAATYAIRLANRLAGTRHEPATGMEKKLDAILRRAA
jgi:hypothetical protein